MKEATAVLVGAGWVGLELARRLADVWDLIIIDTNPRALANPDLPRDTRTFQGDATSALVMKKAGCEGADVIVTSTLDDDVNLEAARVGLSLGIPRAVVLLRKPENLARAEEIGAEGVIGSVNLASALESRLQEGVKFTGELGLGQGEIAEARVLPGSTSVGMALRDLAPRRWLVAAVYRGDHLIIPHGDTVLAEGDRVLLVGEPEVLPSAVELVRTGLPKFPLRYGARALVVLCKDLPETYLEEALYLASESHAEDADFFHAKEADYRKDRVITVLAQRVRQGDYGVVVFPPFRFGRLNAWGKRHIYQSLLDNVSCPVLIPRSTFPYKRFLVPVSDFERDRELVEVAVDAARTLGAEITLATVFPPHLVAGRGQRRVMAQSLEEAFEMVSLYRLKVSKKELTGNPVRAILKIIQDHDLIVTSRKKGEGNSLFSPSVGLLLAGRAPVSALVVPRGEG